MPKITTHPEYEIECAFRERHNLAPMDWDTWRKSMRVHYRRVLDELPHVFDAGKVEQYREFLRVTEDEHAT